MDRITRISTAGSSFATAIYGAQAKGLERTPAWLECTSLLELNGKGTRLKQQAAYQRYVEEAVRERLEGSPLEQVKGQLVLGSRRTWEKIRKAVRRKIREQPRARRLSARPSFVEIRRVVERMKGQKWQELVNRHGDWGRDLALYLGRRLGGMKLRELGREVGGAAR